MTRERETFGVSTPMTPVQTCTTSAAHDVAELLFISSQHGIDDGCFSPWAARPPAWACKAMLSMLT